MSKSREDNARLLREATNELMAKQFETEMGQKVRVERHKMSSDRIAQLRDVLREMGKDLQAQDVATKDLDYLGSFSVHVYASHALQQMFFHTLTAPDKCNFQIADAAMRELNGSVQEDYGQVRQKRRSGAS